MSSEMDVRLRAFLYDLCDLCGQHGVIFSDAVFDLEAYDRECHEILETAHLFKLYAGASAASCQTEEGTKYRISPLEDRWVQQRRKR